MTDWTNPRNWPTWIRGWRELDYSRDLLSAACQAVGLSSQQPCVRTALELALRTQSLPSELRGWRAMANEQLCDAFFDRSEDFTAFAYAELADGYLGDGAADRVRTALGRAYGDRGPDCWSTMTIDVPRAPCDHPVHSRYVRAGGGAGCYKCSEEWR